MTSKAEAYRSIVEDLKGLFATGCVGHEAYQSMLERMHDYLAKYPDETASVNADVGYPRDYDFDYGGRGPSHIRWAFVHGT